MFTDGTKGSIKIEKYRDCGDYPERGIFFSEACDLARFEDKTLLFLITHDSDNSRGHILDRVDLYDFLSEDSHISVPHTEYLAEFSNAMDLSFEEMPFTDYSSFGRVPISDTDFNSRVSNTFKIDTQWINVGGRPKLVREGFTITDRHVGFTLDVLTAETLFELRFGSKESQMFILRALKEAVESYISDHEAFAEERALRTKHKQSRFLPLHLEEIKELSDLIDQGRFSKTKASNVSEAVGALISMFQGTRSRRVYGRFRQYLAYYLFIPYMNRMLPREDNLSQVSKLPLFEREVLGAEFLRRQGHSNAYSSDEVAELLSQFFGYNVSDRVVSVAFGIYKNGYPHSGKNNILPISR